MCPPPCLQDQVKGSQGAGKVDEQLDRSGIVGEPITFFQLWPPPSIQPALPAL